MMPVRKIGVSDLNVVQKHLARIRGCPRMSKIEEKDCLDLLNKLTDWRKNVYYGDRSLTFGLADMIEPYGMSIDMALWCISFLET